MRHFVFSALFILFSFAFLHNSYAQGKWSVGPAAAVSYNIVQSKFDNLDPGLGYSAGLSTMHFFTPHLFASAGLSYTKKSFTLTSIPDTRYIFSGGIRYFSMKYALDYLSLPVEVGYSFFDLADHKFSILASAGIQFNELFHEKIKTQDFDPAYSQSNTNNSFSTTAIASLGLLYNISPRLFLMVKPQYGYDFYDSSTDELFSDGLRFHSFSLYSSLQYKLGR